jgi:hypothetical protein
MQAPTALDNIRPLSPKIADLLQYGDRDGDYADPAHAVLAIALGCAAAGWPRELFRTVILDPVNKGGLCLHVRSSGAPRPEHYGRRAAERAWDKAIRRLADQPVIRNRAAVEAQLRLIRAAADHHVWKPRSGVTDRLVLDDHLETAARMGKLSHTRSVRETAEAKGFESPATAARANRRLVRAGWLTLLREGRNGEAAFWRVRVPDTDRSLFASTPTPPDAFLPSSHIQVSSISAPCLGEAVPARQESLADNSESVPARQESQAAAETESVHARQESSESVHARSDGLSDALMAAHDVWRPGGLGKPCLWCYLRLRQIGPTTAKDLTARLGRKNVDSLTRHLTLLCKCGLVAHERPRWRALEVDTAFLDALAIRLGTAGTAAQQHARHEHQRADYQEYLALRRRHARSRSR